MRILRDELQGLFSIQDSSVSLIMDNIGMLETPTGDSLSNSIVMTVINIEDQRASGFLFQLKRNLGFGNTISSPANLFNFYILFSCNYSGLDYELALRRIDLINRFFHDKPLFAGATTVGNANNNLNAGVPNDFKMEFCNLTFIENNQLWSSLGGRQVPSVLYKLRFM